MSDANRGKQPGRKQLAPEKTRHQSHGDSAAGGTAETPESDLDRWREEDEKLDQALKGTFPASDPFSI